MWTRTVVLRVPTFTEVHYRESKRAKVLLVHAFTAKRCCQWELILTATVDGVESQYTIRRSSGAPFETTALTRSYKQAFEIDFFNAVFKKVPPGRLSTGLEADLGRGTS